MANSKPLFSLKSSIVIAIVVVSFVSLSLSLFFTNYYEAKVQRQEAQHFVKAISAVVAENAIEHIQSDNSNKLKIFLSHLANIKEINNIHVYNIDKYTDGLAFFSSFNQAGSPALKPQFIRVKRLGTPLIDNNHIEYSQAITSPNSTDVLGYVYVRMQLDYYQDSLTGQMQFNFVIAVLIAIGSYLISIAIQKRILLPIDRFVGDIKTITVEKSYDKQIKSNEFIELQELAKSINTLLTNINKQMFKFGLVEKEITELNRSLEEKVVNRTQALRDSNQELLDALEQVHQYQSQVIQSEKMASLGQMVAGVAHEVNTPIGLGVTASTMLTDKIDEIISDLDNKTLSAKKLRSFLSDSKENNQLIYRNLSRAAELINSFKQVAVDQAIEDVRTFNIKELMSEILLTMNPTLKQSSHNIAVHCDNSLTITSKAGPLNQIIINLVMNSLLHGFKNTTEGNIDITIWQQGEQCHIRYQDNGSGIEERIKQKIFDPFVTTSRGKGGSGLGMHLVYNLVTQALKGHIDVKSELGHGAQFDINFPAKLAGVK